MSLPKPGDDPVRDAETLVPTLVGMSIAFGLMSTIIVAVRLYTRYAIVRSPGSDDVTIAIAQILSIGVSVVTILQAKYALGRHVWMVSAENNLLQLRCFLAAMTIYNLAQIITKMSFLLQYRRIFPDGGYTRRVCLWMLIFLAAWGITQEFLVCFTCVPAAIVIPSLASVCIDSLTVYYLTSAMNIATDFIVFLIPLPAVYALHLATRQKLLVISIFCLGFFTCIISIVRLFTLHSAVKTTDPTWDNVPSSYWSVVELNCGILCACLPTLRPFLRHFNIRGFTHKSRSYGYQREGSDIKVSFHSGGDLSAPGASAPVYPMERLAAASQEALHNHAADAPTSSMYQPPEYAGRHTGRNKTSRLTNNIKGGRGVKSRAEATVTAAMDDHEKATSTIQGRRERSGSGGGIRVTREIGYEKEEVDERAATWAATDSDEARGNRR